MVNDEAVLQRVQAAGVTGDRLVNWTDDELRTRYGVASPDVRASLLRQIDQLP